MKKMNLFGSNVAQCFKCLVLDGTHTMFDCLPCDLQFLENKYNRDNLCAIYDKDDELLYCFVKDGEKQSLNYTGKVQRGAFYGTKFYGCVFLFSAEDIEGNLKSGSISRKDFSKLKISNLSSEIANDFLSYIC